MIDCLVVSYSSLLYFKILNWLATIWSSCFFIITPLYFIIGFLFSFSFGGFTGLILANSLIDIILHDSYFIVGHFHYVLSLGAVYSIFAAIYTYWVFFSIITPSDYLGRIQFGWFFISTNLISLSMHTLGIIGFPRRIYDYGLLFFRFQWINSLGLIGIYLGLMVLCIELLGFSCSYIIIITFSLIVLGG